MSDSWQQARAVADAVLYEGYLLYPYRASAEKNRLRWQFGVLVAPDAMSYTGEPAMAQTECLFEAGTDTMLRVQLRFLHLRSRVVEVIGDDGELHTVDSVTLAGTDYLSWDEAVEREVEANVPVARLLAETVDVEFAFDATEESEPIGAGPAGAQGRIVRRCLPVRGMVRLSATALPGPFGGALLRVQTHNTGEHAGGGREQALRHAMIGAHTLLWLPDGAFLSLVDPPQWAAPAAAGCVNIGSWPVLVGDPQRCDAMLSAPIILYDFPTIAPESAGPLFDGTEIDEILTLRTMTLTDDEKRQARATDDRARELLDRVDTMPPELLDRLHGTVRYLRQVTGENPVTDLETAAAPWWDPAADSSVDPDTDAIVIDGVKVAKGSRVRLAPRLHTADAQDMFLVGRTATVQAVVLDVDGEHHLAVTIDDDPAAELQTAHGRFRYFAPTEVEPLPADQFAPTEVEPLPTSQGAPR